MGPALGGWLTYEYSWRWVFFINLPVGMLCILGNLIFYSPDPLRASGTVRFQSVPDPEPGDRRPAIDARPGRAEGLVPFERNLDRGDGRRARFYLFTVHTVTTDERSFLNRFIEERQFRRRHRAGVLCRLIQSGVLALLRRCCKT